MKAAAEALEELEPETRTDLLEDLEPERAADLLEEMSPDEAADAVAELLDQLPRLRRFTFRRLSADFADRIEVIIRFLAVLELYKQGAVEIDQPERFGDIEVIWSAGDDFDTAAILIDAYDG